MHVYLRALALFPAFSKNRGGTARLGTVPDARLGEKISVTSARTLNLHARTGTCVRWFSIVARILSRVSVAVRTNVLNMWDRASRNSTSSSLALLTYRSLSAVLCMSPEAITWFRADARVKVGAITVDSHVTYMAMCQLWSDLNYDFVQVSLTLLSTRVVSLVTWLLCEQSTGTERNDGPC